MAKRRRSDWGRWHEVLRAIRQAITDRSLIRGIDIEAAAGRRSWARAIPGRVPTVHPTGHPGAPRQRDPMDAVERGRMRALIAELEPLTAHLVTGEALGVSRRATLATLREKGVPVDNSEVVRLVDGALRKLEDRMREVGLLA